MANDKCEYCAYYTYDEYSDCYCCEQDLDEDEMARFMTYSLNDCPYFKNGDEYAIVRKQN